MRSDELLGERIRIWDGRHSSIRCEGRLIGIIPAPILVIEDDEGQRHYEPNSLPFDYEVREWRDQIGRVVSKFTVADGATT